MSDHDSESSITVGRSDRSSRCPQYSQVDSTINLTPLTSSCRAPEEQEDYESLATTTDLYERYFSSQSFNTSSVDQNPIKRGVLPDSNISGPAPNTGMPVCYAPPVGTGPTNKGGELLEAPNLTTPRRSNTQSPHLHTGVGLS